MRNSTNGLGPFAASRRRGVLAGVLERGDEAAAEPRHAGEKLVAAEHRKELAGQPVQERGHGPEQGPEQGLEQGPEQGPEQAEQHVRGASEAVLGGTLSGAWALHNFLPACHIFF